MAFGNTAYSEAAFSAEDNNAIAYPQGNVLTGSMGEESNVGDANVNITGIQATITNGGAVAGSSVLFSLTGSQLTSSIGEEDINVGVPVTGSQLSISNKETTQDTLTAFGEAPFASQSPATFFIPSVEVFTTTGAGTLPSFLLQTSIGEEIVTADANVSVAGISLISSIGQVDPAPDVAVTGIEMTSSIGTVNTVSGAIVDVTGSVLTLDIGEENSTADANVSVTGSELTLSTNDVTFEITADIDVTGSQANISLGTYSVSADGNVSVIVTEHTMVTSIGSVTNNANADVSVSGLQLTGSVGDLSFSGNAIVELTNFSGPKFSAEGNAALSTDQAKFGVSSLELDGTNDSVDSTTNLDLSSTDFTVDVWIRPDNVTGYKGIWQSGTSTKEQSYLLGNQVYWTVNPSTIITTSVTVSAGVWTMLSYEREGNTHRIYKNGTLEDTVSTGNKQDNGPFTIGKNGFGDFNGYIDELRVSDIARYGGSSFAEPTSEFSVDSDTIALLHFDGADGSTDMINAVNEQSLVLETNIGDESAFTDHTVEVTGQELTMSMGEETPTADANVELTGIQLTSSIGTVDAIIVINVTGIQMSTSIGSVIVTGNANIDVTGIELQSSAGNANVTAWAEIDPGVSNVWTEVDLAA